jgi:CheY-like chemotaxis protein/two-component sensor histidine kinase
MGTTRSPTVALPELVEGVCASLLPMATAKDVELGLFISPRAPMQIWSDPTRLRLVLFSLLSNAILFSGGRDRSRRVDVRVDVALGVPASLVLRVSDNGVGMEPAVQDQLFKPILRAEISTTQRVAGSGLGLTIAKRLTRLMEGEIDVQSAPGNGSTFTVMLPLRPAPGNSHSGANLAGVHCVIVGRGTKIDDMRVYLEHAGAQVQLAADAATAIRLASGLTSPVVIQGSWVGIQSPDLLRAAYESVADARHVLVALGPRREFRDAPGIVVVDGNCLRRSELVNGVAIASGRPTMRDRREIDGRRSESDCASVVGLNEARKKGRVILVAEDDELTQSVIRQQIQFLGYTAVVVGNGSEAYAAWRECRFSLLLTDLSMPEMDGYSLAGAIRRDEMSSRTVAETRMPILAFTANAQFDEAIRVRAAGMDDYLTKPIRLRSLKVALQTWMPVDGPHSVRAELLGES